MKSLRPQYIRPAVCATSLLLLCSAVQAANESAPTGSSHMLEEVTVFARKREESVQDVPLSMTALSGDALQNKGLTSALELTKVSPNLTTNSAYGETQPNYALRGVSVANEFNPNQASPIGVYVDESYMSNRISHGLSLFDIERVEVLRGPQGTLYGRNTTAGAISVYTRKPSLDGEVSGYIDIGLGSHQRRELNGAIETSLNADNTLGARLAVKSLQYDGLIENKVPGKDDSNSADTLMGRLTLRLQPSDTFDSTLAIYSGRNEPTSAGVYSLGVNPATGDPAVGGVNPYTGYSRSNLDFFETEMEEAGEYQTEGQGILLRASWDVTDRVQITSITSYDEGGQDLDFDADGSPVNLLTDKWKADFKQFNQELRTNIEVNDTINLVAGIYYGEDEVEIDYHNLFFDFYPALRFETSANSTQKRDSTAVFGEGNFQLTEKWGASLGLRWTRDNIVVKDYDATYRGLQTIGPNYSTPEESSSEITGRVTTDYQFRDDLMGYASFSRGYRGGAYNASTSSSLASLTYVEPEFVDAWEVGLKYQSDDQTLTVNGALFYYDYTDQQLQELISAISYLRNAGKSTLQGAELEVSLVATDNLVLTAALGLLQAEYEELTLSGENLDGNTLPFAPEVTGNISADWYLGQWQGIEMNAYINASYVDHQYFSPFNEAAGDQNLQQDGYWSIDANIRFETSDIYGALWIKNLTSDEHFVYGIDTNALGYSYLVQGSPRTWGATLGLRF